MTVQRERAMRPEDVSRLIVERVNLGDAAGIAELYEPEAVLDYPLGHHVAGREAIRTAYEQMLAQKVQFKREEPLPTIQSGDLALTATRPSDDTGGRVQVVRRQPDGSWLRVLDRPETRG
jgi:ketosteroid isomerase-like protein